jgi:hypothetical protein
MYVIETDPVFLMAEATDRLIWANSLYVDSIHTGDMHTAYIALEHIEAAETAWRDARDNAYLKDGD